MPLLTYLLHCWRELHFSGVVVLLRPLSGVLYRPSLLRVRAWFKSVAMVGQSSKQKEEESEREEREGGTATAVNKSGPTGIRKVFKRPRSTSRPLQSDRTNRPPRRRVVRAVGAIGVWLLNSNEETHSSSFSARKPRSGHPVGKQVHFPCLGLSIKSGIQSQNQTTDDDDGDAVILMPYS